MVLLAGGGALVRAAGWGRVVDVWRGLLRGRLLQRPGASSPQAAAGSIARFCSDGLRARHERDDVVFDVLLQRPGATGADTGRFPAAFAEFCSCGW